MRYTPLGAALRGAAVIACALVSAWPCALRAGVEIKAIEMTVADLPRALAFYTEVLQCQLVSREEKTGEVTARLRLGEETLILRDYAADGRPIPDGLPANDRSFQHIAIVVGDIDAAYAHLLRHDTGIVAAGVQRLPDWNFDAAGIRALYFHDPDGYFLELIQFPNEKGEPRWHRRHGPLFRGIDHSAIVVSAMKRSVAFYRDEIGLSISGGSVNYGGEQELLSQVRSARVRITSLRGAKGPGLELLQYEKPGLIRALAGDPAPNDSSHWQIDLQAGTHKAEARRDPDGHALAIRMDMRSLSRRDRPTRRPANLPGRRGGSIGLVT